MTKPSFCGCCKNFCLTKGNNKNCFASNNLSILWDGSEQCIEDADTKNSNYDCADFKIGIGKRMQYNRLAKKFLKIHKRTNNES